MRKIVLKDSNKEFPLGSGISIGSAAANTIQISSNKVEAEHAAITKKGDHIWIEDLNTRYGLTVNGKKVSRWALKKDDVIEIGGTALVYGEDDKPEPPPPAPKKAAAPAAASDASKSAVKPAAKPADKSKPVIAPAARKSDESAKSAAAAKPASSKSGLSPAASSASGKSQSAMAPADPKISVKTIDPVSVKAMTPSNSNGSGLNTAVKPRETVSSSRNAIPARKSGLLGAVGTGSSSRNAVPAGGTSSARLVAEQSYASVSQAALEAIKERSGRSAVPVSDSTGKLKVVVAILVLLVFVLGVTTVIVLSRGTSGSSAMSEEEREARERLKQKAPKDHRDLEYVQQKLFRLRTWQDVEEILGEADLVVNDKIPLYEADRGTYEQSGHEFRGWYIKDPFNTANSDSTVASVLLFQGDAQGQVTYLSSKIYSRMKLPAAQQATTINAENNLPEPIGVTPPPAPESAPPEAAPVPTPTAPEK